MNRPVPMRRPAASRPPTVWEDLEDAFLLLAPHLLRLVVYGAGVAGLLLVILLRPQWLAGAWASLTSAQPKVFWYLSRSSAVVGFGLLWMSMVLGLTLSGRMTRIWPGGPTFNALHEHTSLLGLALGVFHAFILYWDPYIHYTLTQILTPFASVNYRPAWVALGQLSLYLLLPVTFTFYVRRWIGVKVWRWIHYLSFLVFFLVLAHGLFSGTDTGLLWLGYWLAAVSVAGLFFYRVVRAVI